ncbi:MAG: efflux RND transporter periplasmic adaptor subunit [Nitrosomonadales bacterium]|nr:efflux RND transporter periplasmic adaptor subunit [Nitrosomonadales bacterium]
MSAQKIKILLVGVALAILFAWVVLTQGPLAPVKVTVEKVQVSNLANSVFGIGILNARHSYNLAPTITSRVKSVLVDQGDSVVTGQVLAEMDPIDLDDKLAGSQRVVQKTANAILAAEAQVSEAQSRFKTFSATATRYQELRERGFVSQEMYDAKQHEKNAAEAALAASSANLAIARDEHARSQIDARGIGKARAQTRLVSPIDGVVAARSVESGSTLVGGQVALQVIDPNSLWVETRIAQQQAGLVRVGQVAEIMLRSQPHVPLMGKVARIDIVSDAVTEERIVNVSLHGAQASIGEYAEVTLKLPALNDTRSIPSAALKRVDNQNGVWVLQDSKVAFKSVKIGLSTMDGRTQILDGLVDGDEVIVYSQQALREGLKVKVVSALVKG